MGRFQEVEANHRVCVRTVEAKSLALTTVTPALAFRQKSACQDQNANQSLLGMSVVPSCSQSSNRLKQLYNKLAPSLNWTLCARVIRKWSEIKPRKSMLHKHQYYHS